MAAEEDQTATDEDLGQNEAFDLLNNSRRRYVLYLLETHDEAMPIGDLADEVASWEQDKPIDELTQQERKRVHVSLYQTHLVRLDERGVVEFDRDSGMVTITPKADQIRRFLPCHESTRPWGRYYLGFVGVGLLLFVAKFAGFLEVLAFSHLAVGIYLGFVLLTVPHYVESRTNTPTFADLVEERVE